MNSYVYVVYDYDNGPYCISIHETAEKAIEGLNSAGLGKIAKIWWNTPFQKAIREWEKKEESESI